MTQETLRHLERARELIACRYDGPLTLEDAAREAGWSPFHFHRLFSNAFGETPHEFLTSQRIGEARRLLAQGEMNVSEVCAEVGYASLGSFSSRFRELVGCSPTEYREGTRRFYAVSRIRAHRFVPMCFVGRIPQDPRSTNLFAGSIVEPR